MKFLFADYSLDTDRCELYRDSALVEIEPQVFNLLLYLVQNRDRIVSKDDLVAAVWGGRDVTNATLASGICAARKALGESGETQKLIRTIHGKGVRFAGEVRMASRINAIRQAHGEEASFDNLPVAGDMRTDQAGAEPAPGGAQERAQPAIAVLPFTNMSNDPGQACFVDGITQDIITALSRVSGLSVIARHSPLSFKGTPLQVKRLADELGVGYFVEGSVRRSGDHVRITVHLIDVATGRQLWRERYDRCVADVFAVQDEITGAIVPAVEMQVSAAESVRAARNPPASLAARDLVTRGLWHFWQVTRDHSAVARALLKKAIALDPDCAQAHAALAFSHVCFARMGWEDRKSAEAAARRSAQAALRADAEEPWTHLAVGTASLLLGRMDDAMGGVELALSLNPNFSLAQSYYGVMLTDAGRWREGADMGRRALLVRPRAPFSAFYSCLLGYAAFAGGNYDEAMRATRATMCERPSLVTSRRTFIAAAAMKGEIDVAKDAVRQLRRLQPDVSLASIATQLHVSVEREHLLEGFRRAGL